MDQPTAEEALERLEPLVGEWTLEAKPPDGPPWPGEARATIEWHDSGAHLVPALDGGDARGTRRRLDHGMRRRERDLLPALLRRARRLPRLRDEHQRRGWNSGARANCSQRFSATISDDGNTIVGRWEKAPDGRAWETDFDLTYRKAR